MHIVKVGDYLVGQGNPLMLMALMGGSEGKDFFPMMLMMSQLQCQSAKQEK